MENGLLPAGLKSELLDELYTINYEYIQQKMAAVQVRRTTRLIIAGDLPVWRAF